MRQSIFFLIWTVTLLYIYIKDNNLLKMSIVLNISNYTYMYTTKANINDYKETVLYCLEASSRSTV